MALKKSDLYSSLWASCDQLRGGMDASQYKDYVLFMLFIKYITDDYVVANPPCSDKTRCTGLTPGSDPYQRFAWGEPPAKQGEYAYLLHIVRSMKGAGKAACILVLDMENAAARRGVFMIDASKGFIKSGNKNRLREQDIHRIVDTFNKQIDTPRYALMVPFAEIADPRNDYNLSLPRYIDSTEPEDLNDIDAHLNGGIPERDLDAPDSTLADHWQVFPGVRAALFESAGRLGYAHLKLPLPEVKAAILGHEEFSAFNRSVTQLFADWRTATTPRLIRFGQDDDPKALIETIAEDLLAAFRQAPLLDAYDIYQHLMDYWAETRQDDCYLIAADGWVQGAQPRELVQVKNKDNKLVWPEPHDYLKGRRRFKSDLIPASILVARYFAAERDAIEALDAELASIEQQLDEQREEQGEDGKQKVVAKAVKTRLKEIGKDPLCAEEREALLAYADLLDRQADTKAKRKAAQEALDKEIVAKYPKLTEAEIKAMVVDINWMARVDAALLGELDRVSQSLTGRIRELAERYATTLLALERDMDVLAERVAGHLLRMGFQGVDDGR